MPNKKKVSSRNPLTRARSVASAETVSSYTRNRLRRSRSVEAHGSIYKEEFVDHVTNRVASRVPATIYSRTKDLDMLAAAVSGDDRAQAALMGRLRRMRTTEHNANFTAFSVQQMKDAIGVSPDLEARRKRMAETYERIRERVEKKVEEKKRQERVMEANQAIASDLIKGLVDIPGQTPLSAIASQTEASKDQRNRQRKAHKAMLRGVPKAAAQRAARRSDIQAAQDVPFATLDQNKHSQSRLAFAPAAAKETAPIDKVPSIVPDIVAYLADRGKALHIERELSEARTTAPPVSSVASLKSEISFGADTGGRPQTSDINKAWEEYRSPSSKSCPGAVPTKPRLRPSSAPSIRRPPSVLISRKEHLSSTKEIPSDKNNRASDSAVKTLGETSPSIPIAPFATPFPNQFDDNTHVQTKRPASAPAHGRMTVAPQAPFSAPFTPHHSSNHNTIPYHELNHSLSDLTFEQPQGSAVNLLRAQAALSRRSDERIPNDNTCFLRRRPASATARAVHSNVSINSAI